MVSGLQSLLPCSPSLPKFYSSSYISQRRQWHPTPVLLPGKSHGRRNLVGCSPWGLEEWDTTERLHFHFSLSCIGEGNGNPLQCSCLENPRDRGAWWAAVYGVAQSRTQLKQLSSSNSNRWISRRLDKDSETIVELKWCAHRFSPTTFVKILGYMFKICIIKCFGHSLSDNSFSRLMTDSWGVRKGLKLVFPVPPGPKVQGTGTNLRAECFRLLYMKQVRVPCSSRKSFREQKFHGLKIKKERNFPGSLVVEAPCFHCRAPVRSLV